MEKAIPSYLFPKEEAERVLEWLENEPSARVCPFERRGRRDAVVFLNEKTPVAAGIRTRWPEASWLRTARKKGESVPDSWVAWESIGQKRYVRLRRSPSRITRAGVNLAELPIPGEFRAKTMPEAFREWCAAWGIKPAGTCRQAGTILRGAFYYAAALEQLDRSTSAQDLKVMGVDQNQRSGTRYHLLVEQEKPISPLPVHILLFAGEEAPKFRASEPSLASDFRLRENHKDQMLLGEGSSRSVRFYLNPERALSPATIPDVVLDILNGSEVLPEVLAAIQHLKDFATEMEKRA